MFPNAIEVFDLAENEDTLSPVEMDPEKLAHKFKEVSGTKLTTHKHITINICKPVHAGFTCFDFPYQINGECTDNKPIADNFIYIMINSYDSFNYYFFNCIVFQMLVYIDNYLLFVWLLEYISQENTISVFQL